MRYLFFNTDINAYIPSEITDYRQAKKMWEKLAEMFPTGMWDYSNANWTVRYFKGS